MNPSIYGMTIKDESISKKYNIADLPLYLNKEDLMDLPHNRTVPHWNKDLETIFMLKGSMKVIANGVSHTINEREICIIQPGCVHFIEKIPDQTCVYYCGIFNESLFAASEGIIKKYITPIFHSMEPGIEIVSVTDPENEELIRIFTDIHSYLIAKPVAYDLIVIARFYEYLALLCRMMKHSMPIVSTSKKSGESLKNMITYIHENFYMHISTEQLCEVGITSRNQCFRLFKEYTGETPANYILKYRLNMARTMLLNSDLSISHIAITCGFSQQSHFTHHFANHFGITPLQFRKSIAKSEEE